MPTEDSRVGCAGLLGHGFATSDSWFSSTKNGKEKQGKEENTVDEQHSWMYSGEGYNKQ